MGCWLPKDLMHSLHIPKPPIEQRDALKKTLGPIAIWGLGVGYVISGMYFGWNIGLKEGGPVGMLIATILVTIMYFAFVYCYAELACMMPRAGGAFFYAHAVVGPKTGLITGFAQICEFVFAPPAIAYAIGAYYALFFDGISALSVAVIAYLIFTAINIYGIRLSAGLELFLTIFAVLEIFIFVSATAPHFSLQNFLMDPLPHGIKGIFFAIPFAVWFYLAIEGIANIAEEAKDPRHIALGFKSAMTTLAILALLVLFCSVGVAGWPAVVFPNGSTTPSDSPLPLALGIVAGQSGLLYHLLITVGLFGLVASFHGIILASGRATMELGRAGFLPHAVGHTLKHRKTPALALVVNMLIGLCALFTGRTEEVIVLSVLGAILMYILSIVVFFVARKKYPHEDRPFTAPFFPLTPAIALVIALIALISVVWSKPQVALIFLVLLILTYGYFALFSSKRKQLTLDLNQ